MNISRTGIKLLLITVLVAFAVSCNALALSGDKKYKVDLTNILMKIQDEIGADGSVSDKTFDKFDNFMEASKEVYYNKGSYVKAERVMACLVEARGNPEKAFYQYQSAKLEITATFDMLKTEVQD